MIPPEFLQSIKSTTRNGRGDAYFKTMNSLLIQYLEVLQQHVFYSWSALVNNTNGLPEEIATGVSILSDSGTAIIGKVIKHKQTAVLNYTIYYRFVPDDYNAKFDSFYQNFDLNTKVLTNKIVSRE